LRGVPRRSRAGALKRERLKALLLVEKGLASSIVDEKLWLGAV